MSYKIHTADYAGKAQHVTLYERQTRETIWTNKKFLQQVLTAWCIIIMSLQYKWELEQ